MPGAAGFGGSHFDYWSRCTDLKTPPEERIRYCRDMLGRGSADVSRTQILTEVGRAYADAHDYPNAIATLTEAMTADGFGYSGAVEERAEVYAVSGQAQLALADADDLVKANPQSPDGYNDRCWIRAIIGKELALALADCDKAMSLSHPNAPDILDSRAFAEFKFGNLDAAMEDYSKAIDRRSRQPTSLFMRGVIKKLRGDSEGGHDDVESAMNLDPLIAERFASYGVATTATPLETPRGTNAKAP